MLLGESYFAAEDRLHVCVNASSKDIIKSGLLKSKQDMFVIRSQLWHENSGLTLGPSLLAQVTRSFSPLFLVLLNNVLVATCYSLVELLQVDKRLKCPQKTIH